MSSMSIALITLVCILGGALLGLFVGTRLPEHHLSDDSKDTVKLGAGLVATMAALVLGLLVGSAKHSFDAMDNGIIDIGARTIMLDRALADYGPETMEIRAVLRSTLTKAMANIWPEEKTTQAHLEIVARAVGMETIRSAIRRLAPQDDTQHQLQSLALQISGDLARMRWQMIEQRTKSLPTTLVVVLVFWLAMLFASFGLFAPRNATVIAVLSIAALSVAGALFSILEMNSPLDGIIKVSSAPLHKALDLIGK
ncbi:MAG TPA: hypothetical protein DHV85_21200 [Candidatus Accumulibacter sp.]|nr:hypothetical protein [Accumulibacter sp.]